MIGAYNFQFEIKFNKRKVTRTDVNEAKLCAKIDARRFREKIDRLCVND